MSSIFRRKLSIRVQTLDSDSRVKHSLHFEAASHEPAHNNSLTGDSLRFHGLVHWTRETLQLYQESRKFLKNS
eukprot:144790-Prorocentrum_minimum.AAC.3